MGKLKFGNLIKTYRTQKGMTQFELARELGYDSPQFISLLERDQSKVPLNVLGQLVVILGIPESEVVDSIVNEFQDNLLNQINEGKKIARERTR